MFIHNTTFIAEKSTVPTFINWAKSVYIPAARHSGNFTDITFSKILSDIDPQTENFSIQMRSDSLQTSQQWHNDVALVLRDDLAAWVGAEKVLFFSTDMEVIE